MSHFHNKYINQGFTTIELMISQVLGLLVIAAFIALIVPAITALAENNIVAAHQESIRFANNIFHQDITQTGYRGCRNDIPQVSVIDAASPSISARLGQWAYENFKVYGISANDTDQINAVFGNGWNQGRFHYNSTPFGDILLLRAVTDDALTVAAHYPDEESITFHGDLRDTLEQSHLLELNDCKQNTTLHLSNNLGATYDRASDTTQVNYGADHTVNCTALFANDEGVQSDSEWVYLGGDEGANCADESGRSRYRRYQYEPGTRAHMIKPVAYYIGHDTTSGQPALYKLTTAANGTRSNSEALIENVENLRVLFGVDSDGDNLPERYFTSQNMDRDRSRWNQVVSVKVWVMIRTIAGMASSNNKSSVFFPGYQGQIVDCDSNHDVNDLACPFQPDLRITDQNVARRVISMEIAVRNRGS